MPNVCSNNTEQPQGWIKMDFCFYITSSNEWNYCLEERKQTGEIEPTAKLWQQVGSFLTQWDKKHQTTPKALNRKGSRDEPKFWFKTWPSLFCSTVASLQLESNKLWQKKTKRIFLFQQFSFHRRCCKSHMFSTPTVAPRLRFENHPIEWHCFNQIGF